MSGFTDGEFLEGLVCERIVQLLSGARDECGSKILEDAEAVIAGMEPEKKEKLEAYLEMMVDQRAAEEKKLYWGGLMDGIRLAGNIYLLGMDRRCVMCRWVDTIGK